MGFTLSAKDYVGYLKTAAQKIGENKDYISQLDAETGDGDHWFNINLGFEQLVAAAQELSALPMDAAFQKIGMIMMSKIGGSSGILYGGAYMAAGKAIKGKEVIGSEDLCLSLNAMVQDMMNRGKAQPGYKTMIDALYPAVEAYKQALAAGKSDEETLKLVAEAAVQGAESTRAMEAVKGRASYQSDKGVGHLDPGAVTMSYQIECLCHYIQQHLL
ncbi:MAG: dihydroxyacetone kinase subunit DhaL [Oscillospiraceae bacterium]|jgi:dihydroxyacetone kinase-like protein